MANVDEIAYAIGADVKKQDGLKDSFGTVISTSPFKVAKLGSIVGVECVQLCPASIGDMVYVIKRADGQNVAVGNATSFAPSVLYDDSTGTTGTVTLSSSASNFDYMRIYYKKSGDTQAVSSVDVCQPDGKNVSLFLVNSYDSTHVQYVGRDVSISGTSITAYRKEGYYNIGVGPGTSDPTIAITRVEGWNGQERMSGSSSGGGGSATSYNDLMNKPTITEPVYGTSEFTTVTIQGNKTFDELGMHPFSETEIESLLTAADA